MVACTTCVSPSGVRVFLTVVERCIEGLQTIPLTPHLLAESAVAI